MNWPHPTHYSKCVWTLNEHIYQITLDGVFHHQQLDCCIQNLFRLTTKETSRRRISGLLWGGCYWIAVLPKHHSQLHLTEIWTNLFITAFNNTHMTVSRKYITSQWRYMRDMASQFNGNSTDVFRLNKGDFKAQHYLPFVMGIHR